MGGHVIQGLIYPFSFKNNSINVIVSLILPSMVVKLKRNPQLSLRLINLLKKPRVFRNGEPSRESVAGVQWELTSPQYMVIIRLLPLIYPGSNGRLTSGPNIFPVA